MTQARLKRADPNTIQDKLLVGYQGWFTCAGDGEPIGPGHHGWLHWFNKPIPNGGRPSIDLWPDTSEYDPSELYPAPGLATASGEPVYLFSSRNPMTVRRHFHWMALHGVDGVFLQRFASECDKGNYGIRDVRDEVADRVREAAEAEGRVFSITYDVSGVSPDKIRGVLEQDWPHLVAERRILDSPSYLRENGRPVVTLWGFGFNGRNHTPDLVHGIVKMFRTYTREGVYLIAGVPGHWRTSNSDADRDPEFVNVWTECFDAVSPWTIGRYTNEESADRWAEQRIKADVEFLKDIQQHGGRKVDYIPVVFPGGSGFNLSQGKWAMNDISRIGGRFLWKQIYNARRAGVRTIFGAMWDEYDEGTVLMPVVSQASQVPVHPAHRFIALDVDGHNLPSDWYMRITGLAAEGLHGERVLLDTFPVKELQDYWGTRPHYEGVEDARPSGPADVDGVTQAFEEWQVSGSRADAPTDAPPPYSLEDTTARRGARTPVPPLVQHEKRRLAAAQSSAGGANRPPPPPPVPLSTRPPPNHGPSMSTAAIPVVAAAAAAASTLDAGNAQNRLSMPPPVDLSTRPVPRPHSHHAATPSLPSRPQGHVHMPKPVGAYRPASDFPNPHPLGDEYGRGRTKHRSHSRSGSHSRSHSRRRRPSSGHRKAESMYAPHPSAHHSHSHSHAHGHSLSPVSPATMFPAPGSLQHAYSDSVYQGHGQGYEPVRHGAYTPVHSVPVGFGEPYGQHHPGYAVNYPGPPQGFGYQHGYTPHPSSSSYYTSYVPGSEVPYNSPGAAGGSGNVGGVGRGGIASALQAVEGIAGKQTRMQLEKTVKSLSNSLNKFR